MLNSIWSRVFSENFFSFTGKRCDEVETKTRGGGERQASKSIDGISRDHLNRYRFVVSQKPKGKLLDMACGVGYGSYILASETRVSSIDAVDISPDAIDFARSYYSNKKIKYHLGSALNIDLLPETYDVAVSFETVEHIPDDKALIRKIHGLLKKGGLFYFSTPNEVYLPFSKEKFPFHIKHYTQKEIENLMSEGGFSIREAYSQESKQSPEINEGWNGNYNIIVCIKN